MVTSGINAHLESWIDRHVCKMEDDWLIVIILIYSDSTQTNEIASLDCSHRPNGNKTHFGWNSAVLFLVYLKWTQSYSGIWIILFHLVLVWISNFDTLLWLNAFDRLYPEDCAVILQQQCTNALLDRSFSGISQQNKKQFMITVFWSINKMPWWFSLWSYSFS